MFKLFSGEIILINHPTSGFKTSGRLTWYCMQSNFVQQEIMEEIKMDASRYFSRETLVLLYKHSTTTIVNPR